MGQDERFGTQFAHVINLKVPKDANRAKFLAHFWPLGPHRAGPMSAGRHEVKKYVSVGYDERFGTPYMVIAIAVGWTAYHSTR